MKGFLVNTANAATFGRSQNLGDPHHWIFNEELGYPKRSLSSRPGHGLLSNEDAFRLSPIFACQRNISESLAMLPRHFIRSPTPQAREVVTDHPSLDIFKRKANSLMTSNVFVKTLQNHALGWGNGYAELQMEEGGTRVLSAWPIPPTHCRPVCFINSEGEPDIYYEILLSDGTRTRIRKERILHIKGISFDGIHGISIIGAACRAIGLGDALEEFAIKFYEEGMIGGGFIQVPAGMDRTALENLRADLEEMNDSGLDGAHRFKFLYDSVTFAQNFIKPDEAQFILTRDAQIKDFARFYRHPLHKLNEMKEVSYNSAELMNTEWVVDTLQPWGTAWEEEVAVRFFTESEDLNIEMRFNYNALLRGDSVNRSNFYRTMIMSGVMTQNEARGLEDLPPVDGADELLTPLNMTTERISEKQDDARQRVQD